MSSTRRRHKVDRSHKNNRPFPVKLLGMAAAVVTVLIGFGGFAILRGGDSIPEDFVPEVTGAPRVAVAQEAFDYGDVKLNTTIETVFEVQNVGDENLRITENPQVEVVEGC